MKRYQYRCRLLSDVVMLSGSATEGFNPSLDYLPGAKFLGIAAATLYDEQAQATRDLFHSGKVRFGDAFPLLDGAAAFPVPFVWYHYKGHSLTDNDQLFLHHRLDEDAMARISRNGQLKQARTGFFGAEGSFFKLSPGFSIRSSYDRAERRSKDGNMFGYYSLPSGSEWVFVVEDDTGIHADRLRIALTGTKRIGRSRSAEYGLVDIAFDRELTEPTPPAVFPSDAAPTLVYAWSNLCFYDEFGRPTLTPTPEQLGVPGGRIQWDKSQVRARRYHTWNGRRHNQDADRMVIEKGSVFALSHPDPIPPAAHAAGIGSHRAEGFGRVLLNPWFLHADGETLSLRLSKAGRQARVTAPPTAAAAGPADPLLNHIARRKKHRADTNVLDQKINAFIQEHGAAFKGLTNSQWGTIRSYARYVPDWHSLQKLLFDESTGALYRGHSELDWRKNNRRGKLQDFLKRKEILENHRVSLLLKLSAEMAKRK